MVTDLIQFVHDYRDQNPIAAKEAIAKAVAAKFRLTKQRSIFYCRELAIRFSSAKGNSFSNTIAGLGVLQKFDDRPFIVCVVRPDRTEFLLANTTFLKKISHSSHQLRVDNIRGSFLGHDIIREYGGITNCPINFESLFSTHQGFTWEENVERLVRATNNIVGSGSRFEPTTEERATILRSPAIAKTLTNNSHYHNLKNELSSVVSERSEKILECAHINNVNTRGNAIEQTITGGINEHGLADLVRSVDAVEMQLEIKTKLMNRASSPKAYNVDKALASLARGNVLIAFCFVGIDISKSKVTTSTVSIFDDTVLRATRVQFHWAGRNSRGVTQLTGDFTDLFSPNYIENIDVKAAESFLTSLLDL